MTNKIVDLEHFKLTKDVENSLCGLEGIAKELQELSKDPANHAKIEEFLKQAEPLINELSKSAAELEAMNKDLGGPIDLDKHLSKPPNCS